MRRAELAGRGQRRGGGGKGKRHLPLRKNISSHNDFKSQLDRISSSQFPMEKKAKENLERYIINYPSGSIVFEGN